MSEDRVDRLFAPVWAGAWPLTLRLYVASQLLAHLPRGPRIPDAYAAYDMRFASGIWRLAEIVSFTPATAWAIWAAALAGLALAAVGGRAAKPGIALYLLGAWALLASEALNVKAHDRLALWVGLALLVAPIGERGLTNAYRSPAARWALLVVFCSIYGSTGIMKALHEPGWLDGTVMQYHLLHRYHAGGPLAVAVSAHLPITLVMGWWTLVFELAFPVAVWLRRTNPWILGLGVGFHLGVLALMDVGAFSFVSLAAYPALLDPDVAEGWWRRLRGDGRAAGVVA